MTGSTRRRLIGLALVLGALLASAATAGATGVPATPDTTYTTNGTVYAVAQLGTRLYVGGDFTEVGPVTGGGASVDATSGARDASFPRVDGGDVLAAAPDGSGGWYIGGTFTGVAGTARSHIAHVFSSGAVD